jgi:hypothetical protein
MQKMSRGYICIIAILAFVTWTPKSNAYQTYSQSRDDTNCQLCHGAFRDSPYISNSDGQDWGDDLHDIHRNVMLEGDCDTCHSGGKFPVDLDSSDGGDGLLAISCVGCHGRNEDIGNDSESTGRAAGLRQHHSSTGTTLCMGCHSDANSANYTPVGEDVPPSYYFTPDAAHPDKPTDPCNTNGEEDYAGIAEGLDNDGEDIYDTNDPDCGAECGNGIVETGEDCDGGLCCDASCQFEPAGTSCEDGEFCNGEETCDGAGSCQAGTSVDCNDGVSCTADTCNEATDTCDNVPTDSLCDDSLFCNGAETCDAVLGCQPGGGDPCTSPLVCGEEIDSCVGCLVDGDCDDGQFCNGAETCLDGVCQAGTSVDCDDGNACTDDSCDEGGDSCENQCNATDPLDGCCGDPACSGDPICATECVDNDGDGYGDPADPGCAQPELDCNDSNGFVFPGAPEICDGVDNQCPGDTGYGEVDEGCSSSCAGTAAASTSGASPVYGPADLGRHMIYFLFPTGAVVLLTIRRRKK